MSRRNSATHENPVAVIDVDGVLAGGTRETVYSDEAGWNYSRCYPVKDGIALVQALKQKGIKIHLYTARWESDRKVTEEWLKQNHVPYDDLTMNRPSGHIYIDDRGFLFRSISPETNGYAAKCYQRYKKIINDIENRLDKK